MGVYEEIAANKRRSYILVFFFFVILIFLGYVLGSFWGNSYFGLGFALVFTIIYTLIIFYNGDRAILAMSSAKPVKREEYPYLYNTVEGLSIAAGIPMPKVYMIDDSAINAFATGRNPQHASITVTKGAVERLSRTELEGVVAHEMSHIKNYDIRLMMVTVMLVGVIILLSDFMLRSFIFRGGGNGDRKGSGQLIVIVVGLILAILAPIIAQLVKLAVSRKREYLADADGALLTRYPSGLANALKKIKNDKEPLVEAANRATANLFIANPLRKFGERASHLWSTHPPIDERIKKLEAM